MNTQKNHSKNSLFSILLAFIVFGVLTYFFPKENFKLHTKNTAENIEEKKDTIDYDAIMIRNECRNDSIQYLEKLIVEMATAEEKAERARRARNNKNFFFLGDFYEALLKLEENPDEKVNIAYFGDSMTDGDLIVQDIRKTLQKMFGGKGVGYVNITSLSAASRMSVIHKYQKKDWEFKSFISKKTEKTAPYGVGGIVSWTKNDSAKIVYSKSKYQELPNPTFYYGKQESDSLKPYLTFFEKKRKLNGNNILNKIKLSKNDNLKKIEVDFHHTQNLPLFGFTFETKNGVSVDNLSIRGNSGLPLSTLDANVMNAFNSVRPYNLIVLHYGANVISDETTSYNWYAAQMKRVVNHLKVCFPDASILVISSADYGKKDGTEIITHPAVEKLILAQKKYAKQTESSFFNLFEAMGGEGSMKNYVEKEEPWANKDYIHFNYRGAPHVAKYISDYLLNGYQKFKKHHEK
ncbi:SGNH/GDSL hydrolase family protein [Aureivirga marina]|uniref:hypothetical protein n=1 Tax=Aureivirga marina TaxID=1182451 RepID=UPI0018C975DE|nr:hypothetical protein [Aureivirga marina]